MPTRLRRVTAIEVLAPSLRLELTTIDPAASPGVEGVVAETVTVFFWPGLRSNSEGVTDPNGTNRCVATRQGIVPLVPPTDFASPKMTPVQLPATGYLTSTLP